MLQMHCMLTQCSSASQGASKSLKDSRSIGKKSILFVLRYIAYQKGLSSALCDISRETLKFNRVFQYYFAPIHKTSSLQDSMFARKISHQHTADADPQHLLVAVILKFSFFSQKEHKKHNWSRPPRPVTLLQTTRSMKP